MRYDYTAAQITPLMLLWNDTCVAKWKEIESDILIPIPTQAVIADNGLISSIEKRGILWLSNTLRVWQKVVRTSEMH